MTLGRFGESVLEGPCVSDSLVAKAAPAVSEDVERSLDFCSAVKRKIWIVLVCLLVSHAIEMAR
jgi:hypothetical protein